MENNQVESTINISDLLVLLWKNIIIIVTVTLIFTIGANIITKKLIPEKFESKTLINVFKVVEDEKSSNNSDIFRYGSELAKRYYIIADSRTVIDKVKKELKENDIKLDENEIRKSIKVQSVNDTDFLNIIVTYHKPEIAKAIAQAVTNISQVEYENIYENAKVKIIDQANNGVKVGPNTSLNTIIGFVLGLMLSIGFILIKEFLDRTIRDEKDIEKYLKLPVLGSIPKFDKR